MWSQFRVHRDGQVRLATMNRLISDDELHDLLASFAILQDCAIRQQLADVTSSARSTAVDLWQDVFQIHFTNSTIRQFLEVNDDIHAFRRHRKHKVLSNWLWVKPCVVADLHEWLGHPVVGRSHLKSSRTSIAVIQDGEAVLAFFNGVLWIRITIHHHYVTHLAIMAQGVVKQCSIRIEDLI